MVSDIGGLLQPLASLGPRPPDRVPCVSGRPSARQQAELARHDALIARIAALEFDQIAQVTDRAWVRRNRGIEGQWEVPGPNGRMVPLPSCDIWFDRTPGDPPREPNAVQPGGSFGAANRIWEHLE
jgi:hypothetical protein